MQASYRQLQPKNKTKLKTTAPRSTQDERKNRNTYNCDLCLYETNFKSEMKLHYVDKHNVQASEIELRPSNIRDLGSESPAGTTAQQPKFRNSAKKLQRPPSRAVEKSPEPEKPDYPNGMHCRQCRELFYWRTQLYEHYKLHNAEEAAKQKQKQRQEKKIKEALLAQKAMQEQEQQQQQQQYLQLQQALHPNLQQHVQTAQLQQPAVVAAMSTPSTLLQNQDLEQLLQQDQSHLLQLQEETVTTHIPTNNTITSTLTQNSLNNNNNNSMPIINTIARTTTDFENSITSTALTPSNSSSNTNTSNFTLPLDAIPQIVETDQAIEDDTSYFDFNGDKIFADFDEVDVVGQEEDVELDVDDMDEDMESNDGFGNLTLTSDDDFDDMLLEQNQQKQTNNQQDCVNGQQLKQCCAHCKKQFLSQYQFENHMFMHRGKCGHVCS